MNFLFLLLFLCNQNVFSAKPRDINALPSAKPNRKAVKPVGDNLSNSVRVNNISDGPGQANKTKPKGESSVLSAKGKSLKVDDEASAYKPNADDKKLAKDIVDRIKQNQKIIDKVAGNSVKSLQKQNQALGETRDYFQRRNAISPSDADEIIKLAKNLQLKKSNTLSRSLAKTPARAIKVSKGR